MPQSSADKEGTLSDKDMTTMSRRESKRLHIIHQALDRKITRAEKVIVEVRLDAACRSPIKAGTCAIGSSQSRCRRERWINRTCAKGISPGFLWLIIPGEIVLSKETKT